MDTQTIILLVGLTANFAATIAGYVKLRVSIEHRLTILEAHLTLLQKSKL